MAIKLAVAATLAVGVVWGRPGVAVEDKAKVVLKKVLTSQRNVDYLHIETRSFGGGSAMAKVKVQTLANKGITVTILEPSYRAGIVTLDDTRVSQTYLPDQDQVVEQPSPYLLQPPFDLRWKLINQNYKVKLGPSSTIAAVRVREIVLDPMDMEIPTRRMFVDPEHYVVLRYVVDHEADEQTVIFDTKYVEFGRRAASTGFGLPPGAASAKFVQGSPPVELSEPIDSKAKAGFSARLPSELPFGFEISGAYLFETRQSAYVGVKLTDGMATLTVYQWRKGWMAGSPPDATHAVEDKYHVRYGIAVVPGDFMPDGVLERIVSTFRESGE